MATADLSAELLSHPDLQAFDRAADLKHAREFSEATTSRLGALAQFAYEFSPEAAEFGRRRSANIGRIALGETVKVSEVSGQNTDIAALVEAAGNGNKLAEKEVFALTTSEVTEMIIKSGGVMKAKAHINGNNEIVQFGKTTTERQENTARTLGRKLPALQGMINAEGQNAFTWEHMHKLGLTKGKRMIEFSLIPAATRAELAKSGLFLREAIGIIRETEVTGNEVEFTSYLVGGTDQDELPPFREGMTKQEEGVIEEQALDNRFDIDVVRDMYAQMGVPNAQTMTPSELLATPLIVPDTVSGIDFVMSYDLNARKRTGKNVMMGLTGLYREYAPGGRPLTRADYEAQVARSLKLQSGLHEVGREAGLELISRRHEAGEDGFKVGRLMHGISESRAVAYIADNPGFDLTVFGAETHSGLLERRRRLAAGDIDGAEMALLRAMEVAYGTGCPGGGEDALEGNSNIFDNSETNDEDCEYTSKECPMCGAKNVRTKSTSTHVTGSCGCVKAKPKAR